MSYQAYQTAQKSAETPRQMEYRLFAQVTHALLEAEKRTSILDKIRIDALDWNRRVWSTLSTDCGAEGNQLPDELRAGIVSLSIWVSKHTSAVMRGEEEIIDLIQINRTIMEGLATDPSVNSQPEDFVEPDAPNSPTDASV